MALKENDIKWFKPLWRRVGLAIFLTLWLGWELIYTQDMFWALLVAAALAFVAYNYFYAFPKETSVAPLPQADDANERIVGEDNEKRDL